MTGRDWARLLVLATVWSASFFLAAVALRSFGPMTIAACRVGMGALFLLGWMAAVGRTAPPIAQWRDYIVMGLLNNAVPFTLIFWAQQGIESGLAAILNATTPLFTAIIAARFGQELLTGGRLSALVLGVAGGFVLVGPEAWQGAHATLLSEAGVLLAALSYAVAGVFGRQRLAGLAPDAAAGGMLLGSSILMIPAALAVEHPWQTRPNPSATLALLALASFGTALAYGLYFRVLKGAGATNLLLVTLLLPVGALLLGVSFLGERPGPGQLTGLALILLALVLIDGRPVAWIKARLRWSALAT
jgi:drug/metabolite transporter (DMT)-like permease